MRSYLFLSIVLCIAAGYGSGLPQSGAGRIVGGQETSIEKYPTIVQVDSLGVFTQVWGQACAANILNSRNVLSAAHCFDGIFYDRTRRRIRAGSTYRNTGGQLVYIVREFNHPSYGDMGYDGDISVIRLAEALEFNPAVQAGTFVAPNVVMPDHTPVVHAGWGAIAQGGPASPVLQDVTIYTVNMELCRYRYANLTPWPGIITDNMICAGVLGEGGRDACQGDSGGPLYYSDIIIGVVSWGHGCANETYPGVSTAVSPYINWVIETAYYGAE